MLLHLHSHAAAVKTAASLMGDNFIYLWMILRPMLVITVPFIITAAQLDARYSRMPIPSHTPATVTVTWNELPQRETLELSARGLVIMEPAVFVDTLMQSSFRVQARTPGGFAAINTDTFPAGASTPGSGSVKPLRRSGGRWNWLAVFLAASSLSPSWPAPVVTPRLTNSFFTSLNGNWANLTRRRANPRKRSGKNSRAWATFPDFNSSRLTSSEETSRRKGRLFLYWC